VYVLTVDALPLIKIYELSIIDVIK